MDDLIEAKRNLYYLLLNKPSDLTDKEIDILYALSFDEDIRKIIAKSFEKQGV